MEDLDLDDWMDKLFIDKLELYCIDERILNEKMLQVK